MKPYICKRRMNSFSRSEILGSIMSKKIQLQTGFLVMLILLISMTRLIPHMSNFSPLAAIGLFGAAHFEKKWMALLVPLAATFLSDLVINNILFAAYFDGFVWFYEGAGFVYGSYALIVLFGTSLFSNKVSLPKVLVGALGATAIFFLVSNFGSFLANPMYSKDFTGLIACYTAAIPFAKGTLYGSLLFSSVLFGGYYLLQENVPFFKLKHLSY